MGQNDEDVTVVVVDETGCRLGNGLSVDTTTTLIALVSDDPSNWGEAASVWPRYRTPAVCEFVSSVPLEDSSIAEAHNALLSAEAWSVIDFRDKRILIGGDFMPVGRDAAFAMVVDESGKQHCPLSIHLPPWWELHEGVKPDEFERSRQTHIKKPIVNREVLFGEAFLSEVSMRVLEVIATDDWLDSDAAKDQQARYPFTISVHRDWLMTPREDLGGRTPRELLHGATDWIEKVTWAQRMRFEDGGPMIAAPDNWNGFETAPMGSQEMCLYFNLCREVINAAWFWCESDDGKLARAKEGLARTELTQFLRDVKDDWLSSSFEGGSPPSFIIACDRRKVPRGDGVAIEGVDGVESEQHIDDCDCPICEMMADGMFGVGFTSIDGHHLELDDEFAFSMHETREAWEEQQREFAEMSAEMDRKRAEREAKGETDDPFSSAWSGMGDDGPIPGDADGFVKLAFMVAEIVSELERLNAPRDEIKSLNERFADYRRNEYDQRAALASELKVNLQSLADRYPNLVSKSADLQSRIDEAERAFANLDNDFPF